MSTTSETDLSTFEEEMEMLADYATCSHILLNNHGIYTPFHVRCLILYFKIRKKFLIRDLGPHLLSDAERPTVFVRVLQRGQLRKICILAKHPYSEDIHDHHSKGKVGT